MGPKARRVPLLPADSHRTGGIDPGGSQRDSDRHAARAPSGRFRSTLGAAVSASGPGRPSESDCDRGLGPGASCCRVSQLLPERAERSSARDGDVLSARYDPQRAGTGPVRLHGFPRAVSGVGHGTLRAAALCRFELDRGHSLWHCSRTPTSTARARHSGAIDRRVRSRSAVLRGWADPRPADPEWMIGYFSAFSVAGFLGAGTGFSCSGTTSVMPHSLQRTRSPRTSSGTRRIARQLNLGHCTVTAMRS
jgi:hypothetical protein